MSNILNRTTIPDYFKYLAADALLSSKDVCEIFGYANNANMTNCIARGTLPAPDKSDNQRSSLGSTKFLVKSRSKLFWKKDTIVAEINRRNNLTSA